MAFPAVAGTGTLYSTAGSNSTSHAVDLPASIASGDLLIILGSVDGPADTVSATGWTVATQDTVSDGGNARGTYLYRIADGSEGASVTITTDLEQALFQAFRITGWHGTTVPEFSVDNVNQGAQTDVVHPDLTPSWGAADTLWLCFAAFDVDIGTVSQYALTDNQTVGNTGGSGHVGYVASTQGINTATLTGKTTIQSRTTRGVSAYSVAVRPSGSTPITVTLTPATEADAAQAVTAYKSTTATAAVEADAAQALVVTKTIFKTLTASTEADAAQPASAHKTTTATPSTEADAAQTLVVVKTIFVTLTPAVETDAAVAVTTGAGAITITPATETGSAVATSVFKSVTLTPAVETDAAQTLTVTKTIFKALTAAVETATATGVTVSKSVNITPAADTGTALALVPVKAVTLAALAEADAAQSLAALKSVTLSPALETDTAVPPVSADDGTAAESPTWVRVEGGPASVQVTGTRTDVSVSGATSVTV